MMTKYTPTRPRTRMQLTGTVRKLEVHLSFHANAAARLAVLMLGRASSPRPTLSAIARTALLEYAAKLENMTPEERVSEAHAVSRASHAWLPEGGDMKKAEAALEAAEESAEAPLPTLAEVTCRPTGPSLEALELRVNHLLKASQPRKYAHLPTA